MALSEVKRHANTTSTPQTLEFRDDSDFNREFEFDVELDGWEVGEESRGGIVQKIRAQLKGGEEIHDTNEKKVFSKSCPAELKKNKYHNRCMTFYNELTVMHRCKLAINHLDRTFHNQFLIISNRLEKIASLLKKANSRVLKRAESTEGMTLLQRAMETLSSVDHLIREALDTVDRKFPSSRTSPRAATKTARPADMTEKISLVDNPQEFIALSKILVNKILQNFRRLMPTLKRSLRIGFHNIIESEVLVRLVELFFIHCFHV